MGEIVSPERAKQVEAQLLCEQGDYGLTEEGARALIADVREAGGLDALLRGAAREAGAQEIHRTEDPA